MDQNIVQPESNENKEKQIQEEQMRRNILVALLDTPAFERLSRIALVSPERSKKIEASLMQIMETRRGRITEQQFIDLLEKMEVPERKAKAIVYHRRKGIEDDFDF